MAKRSIIKKLSKELNWITPLGLATSSELDCDKFVNIVRPYIEQVPSLLYKIRRDSTKLEFIAQQRAASEARDTLELE